MCKSIRYANITLHSSGQLWSNPALREQESGIPAMLVNPSFLDLVRLVTLFSAEKVASVNAELLEAGEISRSRFDTTTAMLSNISRGVHAH
jgi:hypothetical protein